MPTIVTTNGDLTTFTRPRTNRIGQMTFRRITALILHRTTGMGREWPVAYERAWRRSECYATAPTLVVIMYRSGVMFS